MIIEAQGCCTITQLGQDSHNTFEHLLHVKSHVGQCRYITILTCVLDDVDLIILIFAPSCGWERFFRGRHFPLDFLYIQIRSDQSLSRVRLFATPRIAARQAPLSITNSQSSLRLMPIESVMPSSHLILCRPLLLLPPIPPRSVFSNESTERVSRTTKI